MRRPVVLPIAYDRLVRRPDLSPRRPAALGNEHGWTLLELLVAVGIASLVFTVLLLMQQTVTSFVQRQEQRLDHTVRAARLLDGLSNELSGMFVLEGDESTAPQLKTDPRNGDIELTFWSASLRPLGDEPETVILQRIRY